MNIIKEGKMRDFEMYLVLGIVSNNPTISPKNALEIATKTCSLMEQQGYFDSIEDED